MRQLIIVRKDLNMSPGKLAAQCCHASMAFMSNNIKTIHETGYESGYSYKAIPIDRDIYEKWFKGILTKTILEAKNKNKLLKVREYANELGLVENKDYFLIKDSCLTELKPEEIDENGIGSTLTCIGFKPLPNDIAKVISKKYQLYH